MLFKSAPVEVQKVGADDGLEEGTFEAYVAVFGNVDSYGDRIVKGAFAESLQQWDGSGNPIPVYWSHRMDDPDFNIGEVVKAEETDRGLWVEVKLDLESAKARQVYRLLKGRRVTQFSFAYDVLDYKIVHEEAKGEVWELQRLKLHEVGPTPVGANQETELLAVKAAGHVAERVALAVKAGRVLSTKNEGELRDAYDAIGRVLGALDTDVDESKANATPEVKDKEPDSAKSDEPPGASIRLTRLRIDLEQAALGLSI